MHCRPVRTALFLGVFVAAWAAPAPVRAQVQTPPEEAPIQFGVLSLYPTMQIINAGKDTNIFDDGEDPKEDFTFTAASRVIALVKLGENQLLFTTGNDYVWFDRYAAERSTNTRYAMRLNLSAFRVKPFVGVERQYTRERPNAEIDARARRLERGVNTGFDVKVADRTSLTASIRVDDSSYDEGQRYRGEDLARALNREGRSVSAGVRYELTPLTTLLIAGNYSDDRFPGSHIRDAIRYSVTPTVEFSPDAAIRGQFSAGYQRFRPLDDSMLEYQGVIYDGTLNWTLFGRTTFTVNGGRGTRYSYRDTEPYYVLTGIRLNVAHHLVGPFEALGGGDLEHMAYRWHRGADLSTARVDDAHMLKEISGGVGVNLTRGLKFGVRIERTNRDSPENPVQSFSRTRFVCSTIIGY